MVCSITLGGTNSADNTATIQKQPLTLNPTMLPGVGLCVQGLHAPGSQGSSFFSCSSVSLAVKGDLILTRPWPHTKVVKIKVSQGPCDTDIGTYPGTEQTHIHSRAGAGYCDFPASAPDVPAPGTSFRNCSLDLWARQAESQAPRP